MSTAGSAVELVAHRGFPKCYPENTLLGFEKAINAGARIIEADLQFSRDQQPMVFHDKGLRRLCGIERQIYQMDADRLSQMSPFYPGRFGNRFKGLRMPYLSDLVALIQRYPDVQLLLELKPLPLRLFGIEPVLEKVLACTAPIEERLTLISFSINALQAVRNRRNVQIGIIARRWGQLSELALDELKPELVLINHRRIPVGACYGGKDAKLGVYEVSDPSKVSGLIAKGVSLIETDDISRMLNSAQELESEVLESEGGK